MKILQQNTDTCKRIQKDQGRQVIQYDLYRGAWTEINLEETDKGQATEALSYFAK